MRQTTLLFTAPLIHDRSVRNPVKLPLHTAPFQDGSGRTEWVSGKARNEGDVGFTPPYIHDEHDKPLPAFSLYIESVPGKRGIDKAWMLTLTGAWVEVTHGYTHPNFPDRRLKLNNQRGKPSWVLHNSFVRMQGGGVTSP